MLITGGRVPATLELARTFHKAGHTVFMAESLHGHLSQPSNAIEPNFIVPAPRQEKEAFLNPQMDCITPDNNHSYILSTAMLIHGLISALKKKQFAKWINTFFTSSDVILDFTDPLPFLLQFRSIFSYSRIARKQNINPLEVSTFDIEWDGEDDPDAFKQKHVLANVFLLWRGRRDSNPRPSYPGTHLAGEPIQPLWHLPNIM
jgi:hypothetical protein